MTTLFDTSGNLLPFEGDVRYYPGLFSVEERVAILQQLTTSIRWKQEAIKIFGRDVMQPRLTAWYGDAGKSYSYSGITMHPQPWTDTLLLLKKRVEAVAGTSFNSALLNYYRNGQNSMGWHKDNEKELGHNPVIASLSFGAVRLFKLKHIRDKKQVLSIPLEPGSLLLMQGETQHHWLHQLPIPNVATSPRINIPFRTIYG